MSQLYTKTAQTRRFAFAILTAGALMVGCRPAQEADAAADGSAEAPQEIPVEYVRVDRDRMVDTIVATTTLRSARTATIQSRAAGRLTGFALVVGAPVAAGETVARVDAPELRAALDEARAALQRAESAVADLDPLLAQGFVARRVHDDAVALVEQTASQVSRAELAMGDLAVVAPLSGVVSEVLVADGELVMPNQALARVVSLDELDAVAAIPERDATRLQIGLPAMIAQAGVEDAPLAAQVTDISPIVSARVGTIDVTVRPSVGAPWLRPGTLVSVGIVVDTREDALVIPKRALIWEADEAWVFVVVPAEGSGEGAVSVERRRLVLGYEDARRVEVLEGLGPDDRVIVTGQTALETGDRVSLVTERTDLVTPADAP